MARTRLLCVDDDSSILHLYQMLFESHGYDVVLATRAGQAIRRLLFRPIDLVITDQEMPEMMGCELARKLKKLRPHLPILMVSAAPPREPKTVDGYLAKGVPLQELVQKVEELRERSVAQVPDLTPGGFLPLGSVLATVAAAAYLLPRLLR